MDTKTMFLPKNLNYEGIFKEYPIEKLKHDKLLYVINKIHTSHFFNENITKAGYVVLSSSLLLNILGNNYKDYLQYWINADVIMCDNHYILGEKSKGYRLNIKYMIPISIKYQITDFVLLRNLSKVSSKIASDSKKVRRKYNYLTKWFNSKLKLAKPNDIDTDSLFNTLINKINTNDYYFTIDKFGKRLHTNLTNLKKDLRKLLSYDGEILNEIDIKSSQPYLFIKLLFDYIKKYCPEIYKKISSLFSDKSKKLNFPVIPEAEGLSEFLNDLLNNDIYEAYAKAYFNSPVCTPSMRDDAKHLLLQVLYGQHSNFSKPIRVFKLKYPFVYKVFQYYKKSNYKDFAKLLQRLESKLVLDIICKEIHKLDATIPIFTVHDSILTTEKNLEVVRRIMDETLSDVIGFAPVLRIK